MVNMKDGLKMEVEGAIMTDQWGIDKRENGQYVLTHLPSGKLVWSSKKQTFLKLLIQEPEFVRPINDMDIEHLKSLATAICRFSTTNGWV